MHHYLASHDSALGVTSCDVIWCCMHAEEEEAGVTQLLGARKRQVAHPSSSSACMQHRMT